MPQLEVYYAPGSCSRATLITLEEANAKYTPRLVAFMERDNHKPAFRALNPKGKVPLLVIDGQPLTETLAIVQWLNSAFPEAHLLPTPADPYEAAEITADLAWTTSALHALIARFRFPVIYTPQTEAHPSLREGAAKALAENFRLIDERLATRDWWHGDWSAQDAYLYWFWTRTVEGGFPGEDYPNFAAFKQRMDARPATRRVLAIEAEGEKELQARGASLPT